MIDLSSASSSEPRDAELVDRKLCEGYQCGQYFYRPRPKLAKEGEHLCSKCRSRRLQSEQAAQAGQGWARTVNVKDSAERVLGTR